MTCTTPDHHFYFKKETSKNTWSSWTFPHHNSSSTICLTATINSNVCKEVIAKKAYSYKAVCHTCVDGMTIIKISKMLHCRL